MPKSAPSDVRLLLDENISPNIVSRLWEIGVDTVHVRDRAKLRAPDYRILAFAVRENRAVVTIDVADFEKLVGKKQQHSGILVIPSGRSRDEQYGYVLAIVTFLRKAPSAMNAARNHIVSLDENLAVTARLVCASPPPESSTVTPTQS
jgi:predicted nuclease of predicted toxin-antitoxin system